MCHKIKKNKKANHFLFSSMIIFMSLSAFAVEEPGKIPQAMQKFVKEQKMAGSVSLVIRNGEVVAFDAVGYRDLESKSPMQKNTIFRIASMTKPFVAAAIMMLEEEGKLDLDDPVEKYLPEFKNMWLKVEDGQQAGRKKQGEQILLRKPPSPITIRDILTHTHGMAKVPSNIRLESIREHALVASQLPLDFETGSRWRYGGEGINTAARIVEVLSGMAYSDFLKEKIFDPLGMKDSYFKFPEDQAERVATIYVPGEQGGLAAMEKHNWSGYFRPDGGLLSTASDLGIWMQTILDGGIYGKTRILSEESVKEMTRTQTGDITCGFTEGMSFGLAFAVVKDPQGVTGMLNPGTFGHGGAFGTQYWTDPVNHTIYILMIQRQGFGNGDDSEIRKAFQEIAADL
jgi:CubicO group peptidase (beta-lactamase class C family)